MTITTDTPTFTTPAEAAAWTDDVLRAALREPPDNIHLDSRAVHRFRDDAKLHVTELADTCHRRAYLRLVGTPRDYADDVDAHWAHEGWLKEQWTRAVFRAKYPGRFRYQMPVPGLPHAVAGTLDLFWADANVLFDVKSRSVNAGPPSDKDRNQVSIYAAHLPSHPHAVLIHVPRENLSEVTSYPVEYDAADVVARTAEMAARLQGAVAVQDPPAIPRGYNAQAFPCAFRLRDGEIKCCPFFSQCWRASGVVVPAPSTPAMQDLIRQHKSLSEEATRLEKEAEAIRQGPRKDLEAQMKPYFDEHGDLVAGPPDLDQDLKRITYAGRVSYDTTKAFAKDPGLERDLDPYKKVGEGYFQHRYVRRK